MESSCYFEKSTAHTIATAEATLSDSTWEMLLFAAGIVIADFMYGARCSDKPRASFPNKTIPFDKAGDV